MRVVFGAVLVAVLSSQYVLCQSTDVLEVTAVSETTPTDAARQLLQSSGSVVGGYGGYGGGSPPGGGYGGYSHLAYTGRYGGYGRSLAEDEDGVQLQPSDPVLEYAEQQQARADSQQMAAQQAAGGVSAAAVAALSAQHSSSSSRRHSSQLASIPAGLCYCRYDMDFHTWALGEDDCKSALYARCQLDTNLPCAWLDNFYAPTTSGPSHLLPHEAGIAAFVYEDCSPQPPCACTGMSFDGTDPVPSAVACCRDLRVACKTPFSGVHCQQVEAFCSNDQPAPVLAAWTKHMLLRSDCSAYSGMPYLYMSLQQMQAAAQESAAAAARQQAEQPAVAEALLLREMLHSMAQEVPAGAAVSNAVSTLQQRHLIITLAAIAAGALCVAVVAVMFALRREEASGPITSAAPMPSLCATDEYQALLRDKALTAPQPAACIGSSSMPYSTGLPPRPLPRGGSGSSCLSRVILIGTLSSKGSGTQEPLLQEGEME